MLDKNYNPKEYEAKIYQRWQASGKFSPKDYQKGEKAFSIVMPPPNANDDLHAGHALMATVEDIMIRYRRLLGEASCWIPGSDHAGFETQYVFEKKLNKEGKSRFDYSREELYQMIWDYVQENKTNIENQMKALGSSCDWSREVFTLDPEVIKFVHRTFKNLYDKDLIYRGERIVNFCTYHGTSFSELEVEYQEEESKLWKLRYPIKREIKGNKGKQWINVETTRPETMLGDTAVAVHPQDDRYKDLVGQSVILPLVGREIPIVADEAVDPEFGTGAVKVTPAHDPTDFEIASRHQLPLIKVIGLDGKMTAEAGDRYQGLKSAEARQKVIEDLRASGNLVGERSHSHSVGKCYKCQRTIEPLVIPQWFVKVESLAKKSIKQIKAGKVKFIPERYTSQVISWYENLRDWNISRQIVWGIQIPAWFCQKTENGRQKTDQKLSAVSCQLSAVNSCPPIVTSGEKPKKCPTCGSHHLVQDPDVFDTWFSSGQWPVIVNYVNDLRKEVRSEKFPPKADQPSAEEISSDLNRFYPSSVMETAADILPFWVSRMIMLGLELKQDVPFKKVYLHGLVLDAKGKKMSKSKGNVISPMALIERFGTDAVRFGLTLNAAPGAPLPLPEDDIFAGQKFANKIWNISRFLQMKAPSLPFIPPTFPRERKGGKGKLRVLEKTITQEITRVTKEVTTKIESYRFHEALEILYHSIWHQFADKIIEDSKEIGANGRSPIHQALMNAWKQYLILLHPFMPFVTETIYQQLFAQKSGQLLMVEKWPTVGDQKVKKVKRVKNNNKS